MPTSTRAFTVLAESHEFVFGHLQGSDRSGAYVPSDYLLTLANALDATKLKMGGSPSAPAPLPLQNLSALLEQLLGPHRTFVVAERQRFEQTVREIRARAEDPGGNDDGPTRA